MGDADNEVPLPARDFEAWMDETYDVVEEGLNHLISLTMNLNQHTNKVLSEYKCLACLKRSFLALNLVVIPVVLALLICFIVPETTESQDGNSSEKIVQPVICFCMFLSGAIGIPFYIYSILDSVLSTSENKNRILRFMSFIRLVPSSKKDSHTTIFSRTSEFSLDQLHDLVHVLRHRMPTAIRSGMEIRSRRSESAIATTMVEPGHNLKSFSSELMCALDEFNKPKSEYGDQDESSINERETLDKFPVLYELQLRRYDQSPDLSIKIEPKVRFSQELDKAEFENPLELDLPPYSN